MINSVVAVVVDVVVVVDSSQTPIHMVHTVHQGGLRALLYPPFLSLDLEDAAFVCVSVGRSEAWMNANEEQIGHGNIHLSPCIQLLELQFDIKDFLYLYL